MLVIAYHKWWSTIYNMCGYKIWIHLCSYNTPHHLCCVDCCCGILLLVLFLGLLLDFLCHLWVNYLLAFSKFRFILWLDVYWLTRIDLVYINSLGYIYRFILFHVLWIGLMIPRFKIIGIKTGREFLRKIMRTRVRFTPWGERSTLNTRRGLQI